MISTSVQCSFVLALSHLPICLIPQCRADKTSRITLVICVLASICCSIIMMMIMMMILSV